FQTNVPMAPGTYFMLLEPIGLGTNEESVIEVNFYVNDNSGIVNPIVGMNLTSPIFVPSHPDGSLEFKAVGTCDPLLGFGNNYQIGVDDDPNYVCDDIYYRFEIPAITNIQVNRNDIWFSGYYNLHILNSAGNNLHSSYGNIDFSLEPGIYYLVVDGKSI